MLKYRVSTSFGDQTVSEHSRLPAARKSAAAHSVKTPVDIWTTTGGTFGMGRRVGHYRDGKKATRNPRSATAKHPGPSALPSKWTPATITRKGGQIQIRIGGRR